MHRASARVCDVVSEAGFHTEQRFDWITIDGTRYSGNNNGPMNVAMGVGETLHWRSDNMGTRSGFTICATPVAASPPEAPPLPSLPPPPPSPPPPPPSPPSPPSYAHDAFESANQLCMVTERKRQVECEHPRDRCKSAPTCHATNAMHALYLNLFVREIEMETSNLLGSFLVLFFDVSFSSACLAVVQASTPRPATESRGVRGRIALRATQKGPTTTVRGWWDEHARTH
jgi:hypothetical protein